MCERDEFLANHSAARGRFSLKYVKSLEPYIGKILSRDQYDKLLGQTEKEQSGSLGPKKELSGLTAAAINPTESSGDTFPLPVKNELTTIFENGSNGNGQKAIGETTQGATEAARATVLFPFIQNQVRTELRNSTNGTAK